MAGLWSRLSTGLTKTRTAITERLQNLVPTGGRIQKETWEELEEILIAADVGVEVTEELIDAAKKSGRHRWRISRPFSQQAGEIWRQDMTRHQHHMTLLW